MTTDTRRTGRTVLAGLGLALLAAIPASAEPPATGGDESVIPFADHGGIRDWRADGSRGIWIRAVNGRWFYASFSSQCSALPGAPGVRFVVAPSGVLDRWSSIRLPHDERCFFRTLQSSDAPPGRARTSPVPPRDAGERHSPGDLS
jgi:hypothetical protein